MGRRVRRRTNGSRLALGVTIAWVAMRAAAAAEPAKPGADQPPQPTALTETVEKRLVQLDIGVEGDPEAIYGITAKDFVLKVGGEPIQGLIVDRFCGNAPPAAEPGAQDDRVGELSTPAVAPPIAHPRATFIIFFDQTHLTQAGRALSLETGTDLINRLIVDGTRASIVSNARRVETIVPLTADREKLLAGIKKLRTDLRQWDSYAQTEERRAWQISQAPTEVTRCQTAKGFAREEREEARQSTQRLAFALGVLAEVSLPKALVYFGDNLRQSAGLHFLQIGCPGSFDLFSAESVPSAAVEFDTVISEAVARGVHFFTIQAEGLLPYRPGWDAARHRQAQDALVGLAAETGGEAFLGGASNTYMADRIALRTSCRLLLSFPPGDFPRDAPLTVALALHVPKVKIQTQGRIVIPSQASIDNARLLAAFVDPASSDDGSLRALLIPRGGDGKTWRVGLQLRLRPSGLPDNSAELGASIVRQDKVQDHFSASMATKAGTRAMVLEKSVDLAPGVFAVVAVARDAKSDDIVSTRSDADWPSFTKTPAAIAPIAVLQTGPAAMSRDGTVSSSGSLARDIDEVLDPAASITLETVVCRGAKATAPIVVERWVEDGLPNEFAPMTIAETDGPCVQTVDVLPAGRLREGVVDYRVTARIGDEIVAQERRPLRVGAPPTGP